MARDLLDTGKINVNFKDKYGKSALLIAASSGYIDMVNLLLKYNIDINQVDKEHNSSLILAAKNYHPNIVDNLLKHGADSNIVNKYGHSIVTYNFGKRLED